MKFFVLVSALFVIAAAEVTDPHGLAAVHEKCQSDPETHVDDAVFEKIKNHEKFHHPENFSKHVICMVKGLKLMNEDGTANVEEIKNHVKLVFTEEKIVEGITQKCSGSENTPEKQAWRIWKCLHKKLVLASNHFHASSESSESKSHESHEHTKHGHGHH